LLLILSLLTRPLTSTGESAHDGATTATPANSQWRTITPDKIEWLPSRGAPKMDSLIHPFPMIGWDKANSRTASFPGHRSQVLRNYDIGPGIEPLSAADNI
jgi:hypothetical protein